MDLRRLATTGALALALLPGCALYFGDDDDECEFGGGDRAGLEAPVPEQRDPETGECIAFWGGGGGGGGGGGPCDPAEDPPLDEPGEPLPTWGYCQSACTGLDELTCQATAGCRGIYDELAVGCEGCDPFLYRECWAVDQTGPVQGGGCAALGAYDCSRHDDCRAVHDYTCDDASCFVAGFEQCLVEGDREPVLPCGELATEAACVVRDDCAPIYRGEDCVCEGDACSCTWVFERCEA